MANEQNLIPFDKRTESEQREIQSAGGKASGRSRRKKADFRRTLNLLLTANIDNPDWAPVLDSIGLESTVETAMLAAQIKAAMRGDTKAAYFVAQYAGQKPGNKLDDEEQKIRIDRAKRARDQEVGNDDEDNENIKSFLKAMNPTENDLQELFEEGKDAKETEETGEV